MFKLPPKGQQVNRSPTRKSKSRRLARYRQLAIASTTVIALPALLFGYFVKLKFDRLTKPATIPGLTNPSENSTDSSQIFSSGSSQVTTTPNSPSITNVKLAQFTANNSPELHRIVEGVKEHCQGKKLPIDSLSISLLDLKTGKHSGYRNTIYQYPASVVKLFWLFYAYNNYSDRIKDPDIEKAIQGMIIKSDNLSASQVLDRITNTKSNDTDLAPIDFQTEREKRQQINKFYRDRGYSPSINVSQKTFPIPQLNIMEPKGFDRQLRGENIQNPTRNKITTDDATLLMAEIMQHPRSEMKTLLTRDVDPKYWKKQPLNPIDFNPVHSFFGENLEGLGAEDIVSKAGWTSVSRQEVAYIRSKDGKSEYILTVFGDGKGYAEDKKLFPEISNIVYRKMRKLGVKSP
jgi:beta-lactamase class A